MKRFHVLRQLEAGPSEQECLKLSGKLAMLGEFRGLADLLQDELRKVSKNEGSRYIKR